MNEIIMLGIVGSSIVVVATAEAKLEKVGKYVQAELIGGLFRVLWSLGAVGGFGYLLWYTIQTFLWRWI